MANTLTGLIPVIYRALDTVVREQTGLIASVMLDADAEMVAKNQTITYPIVAARAAADIVPAATGPNPSGEVFGNGTMTIDKSRSVTFPWSGDEQLSVGSMYESLRQQQFEQAFRTLANEVEADLAALYIYASRAYGTPGTTPFASNLSDTAQLLKLLIDNGAPTTDLQLGINTTAGAALRTLAQLTKANEAGSTELRARGILLDLHGFKIRESAQIKNHTKGTGALYVANGVQAAGATDVVIKTGNGTVVPGDAVTLAGGTDKYVVTTGVAAPGTIKLGKPGLLSAVADGGALAIGNNYAANMAFARSAIHLLTRVPTRPKEGDDAHDVMIVQDPSTGLAFSVAVYPQYHQVSYEIGLAWGVKVAKPEHLVLLQG